MTGIKLAVRASALGEDFRHALARARICGFAGIGLDAASSLLDPMDLNASGQREVRHLLAYHDQALSSLCTRAPGGKLYGDLDRVLWHIHRCAQAAADLGAGALCLDVGQLPPPLRAQSSKPAITPQQAGLILLPGSLDLPIPPEPPANEEELANWPCIHQAFAEIAQMADRFNLRIAISSELSPIESIGQALAAARCPLLGIELDPVAILRDRWNLAKVTAELGALIIQIRGRDALKGAGGRTQATPIGRGSTDWPELLHLLDAGAFSGWLTVDPLDLPDQPARAQQARQFLGDLLRPR